MTQDSERDGVLLRDYFAAKILAMPDVKFASIFSFRWAAFIAYSRADQMLEQRKK